MASESQGKVTEILNLLKEAPEGLRATIVEAMMAALAEKSRQDKNGNRDNNNNLAAIKRVKTCKDGHPLKPFTTPKLRLQGDDFVEGNNISCDVCGERINNLQDGYMTCEDACNFDIHTHCFDNGERIQEP